MHQDQWIIQATLESFEAESNERIKQREWVYWVAAAGWGLFEVTRSKMIIFSSPEEEISLLSPHPLFQFQLICCCSYCIRITPRSEKETLQDSQILNAKTPLLKVFIAHCFKERQTFIWNIYKHLGDDGDAIYKLCTHTLHCIYALSTQYLHNIYTVSTHSWWCARWRWLCCPRWSGSRTPPSPSRGPAAAAGATQSPTRHIIALLIY